MNPLEQIHEKIDQSSWDIRDYETIIDHFKKCIQKLHKLGKKKLLRKCVKEHEAFVFIKSPHKKIKARFYGENKYDNGVVKPSEWPDINEWEERDYKFIFDRFKSCKNEFAKTEYGLLLFYTNHLNDPKECLALFDNLFSLSKKYYKSSKSEKPAYAHFRSTFTNALHVAFYKRHAPGFGRAFEKGIKFAEKVHKDWKSAGKYLLRTAIDMTDFLIKYFQEAEKYVDTQDFYNRNLKIAEELSRTNTWGSIYTIDVNLRLCKLIDGDQKELLLKKAGFYEQLAEERKESPGNLASIHFIENALRLYRQVKDKKNIKRLESQYTQIRGRGEFSEIYSELPQEEASRIMNIIKEEVAKEDKKGILEIFRWCPMYPSLEIVNKDALEIKNDKGILSEFGTKITDKFGNTIAIYDGQDDDWAFIESYGFHFQLGTQTLMKYFIEAAKNKKFDPTIAIELLENSWMGESIERNYNRYNTQVRPVDLIVPLVKNLFIEIEKWSEESDFSMELIMITDSLVLKIEALLRYFCDRLQIPTFKQKDQGIVMERNLDELLAALKNDNSKEPDFDENDRWFIKFIMTEKAGLNLRNKIAHGLLDANEYTLEKTVLAFTIIMRLTNYKFKY